MDGSSAAERPADSGTPTVAGGTNAGHADEETTSQGEPSLGGEQLVNSPTQCLLEPVKGDDVTSTDEDTTAGQKDLDTKGGLVTSPKAENLHREESLDSLDNKESSENTNMSVDNVGSISTDDGQEDMDCSVDTKESDLKIHVVKVTSLYKQGNQDSLDMDEDKAISSFVQEDMDTREDKVASLTTEDRKEPKRLDGTRDDPESGSHPELENGTTEQVSKVEPHSSMPETKLLKGAEALPSPKIKDEPVDDEYEKALEPHSTAQNIKDEPEPTEENLQKTSEDFKISAVFSMGTNTAPLGLKGAPAATNTPPKTGALLPSSGQPLSPASSLCVVCSGCKKVLLKGQTAYQRKGSPQLYCSTLCLTSTVATTKAVVKKTCHYCSKEILNPKDVIIAPVDKSGAVKDFCGQICLSSFTFKRDSVASTLLSDTKNKCSMCKNYVVTQHEVNYMDIVHKLCSDECFAQFRSTNKLTMNCCLNCGAYCYTSSGQLQVQGNNKRFCSQSCVTTFRKKATGCIPCTMCQVLRLPSDMVESVDSSGKPDLYCSSTCVTAHKVQTVSSSGASVACDQCKTTSVPQYHLAMSDGSIRNFCSFNCVVSFQDNFNKTSNQSQLNVAPSKSNQTPNDCAVKEPTPMLPFAPLQNTSRQNFKLTCNQCKRLFANKPELVEFKAKMHLLCGKHCAEEFKKVNYIMARCEYCKIDKAIKEVKRINHIDRSFCSEGCKLLYKHDLAKRWGKKHCRNCRHCGSTSQSVVTSMFSRTIEEFCGSECLSLYTLVFCQVAKCNSCLKAGPLKESLKWMGEMKHFCNLSCLMMFCLKGGKENPANAPSTPATVTLMGSSSKVSDVTTPVIANVISLSSAPNTQPTALASTAVQGVVPSVPQKVTEHASTQTDSVKANPPAPRVLKNKALLCRPMTQTKGTSCTPSYVTTETQTDNIFPPMVIMPVPVPVYVPLPMNLYSQYAPQPMCLPLPVPVPMFLPTTLDSAERIVETIEKIKEKIPSDPLQADLILMAEMVAEDNETEKEVKPPSSSCSQEGQASPCGEDFDLEAISSSLNWDEDVLSSQASDTSTPSLLPESTEEYIDLEADFPVESLEMNSQMTEQTETASKPWLRKRARDGFTQKKRPSRKQSAAELQSPASAVHGKLHHVYGVKAWQRWLKWRNAQPDIGSLKVGSRPMVLKEDLLQCTTAELNYGLCKFINEAQRPNGEHYSADSMLYLCLGIQQHLFENGRMENIFADFFYTPFTQEITRLLGNWKPSVMPSGYVHSRVEEEYLWECKQLGAYSPSVLLNTLFYFCTKLFNFKTLAQHQRLSFAHVMRCNKTKKDCKVACLRFYPPVSKKEDSSENDEVPAKRRKVGSDEEEEKQEEEDVVLEMPENTTNPLRCPVRLYEFYLSKCSASVKQRTDTFYLQPERSCVPNSPIWFSSMPLDDDAMQGMLTRILTVRELHLDIPPSIMAPLSDCDGDE
ncbi:zinc finger MYM-type protein 4 isoform X2 [Denticeps clupeoides]|uniref:TRASH domain-containing protein n=1 Tax=Denticeps clupeoides TaxID=299321 RepID=A0AAY4CCS4_9TELE|nr:zinc finger MYM-type protein 4 isoform X2 [Denticeps clupeoides]